MKTNLGENVLMQQKYLQKYKSNFQFSAKFSVINILFAVQKVTEVN